jgi:hypothetical protein
MRMPGKHKSLEACVAGSPAGTLPSRGASGRDSPPRPSRPLPNWSSAEQAVIRPQRPPELAAATLHLTKEYVVTGKLVLI